MLGPAKCRERDHPVTVSLDRLVPTDHNCRHLDASLVLSFVRDWVGDAYPSIGRPSVAFCQMAQDLLLQRTG